jgi:hypothetical protein
MYSLESARMLEGQGETTVSRGTGRNCSGDSNCEETLRLLEGPGGRPTAG